MRYVLRRSARIRGTKRQPLWQIQGTWLSIEEAKRSRSAFPRNFNLVSNVEETELISFQQRLEQEVTVRCLSVVISTLLDSLSILSLFFSSFFFWRRSWWTETEVHAMAMATMMVLEMGLFIIDCFYCVRLTLSSSVVWEFLVLLVFLLSFSYNILSVFLLSHHILSFLYA